MILLRGYIEVFTNGVIFSRSPVVITNIAIIIIVVVDVVDERGKEKIT